ncbi:hypothetical protein K469DRAFT_681342 [Zopfia rhizophila CBS 207.26]|uniref:Uncharacterized protein n=1 Tax=Zopfia rhizophila CBS 207.26 TaxID=1314779 RepID=A0A6A6ETQ4_9PEZI|nr:hypothetical protein K469DRAFT_681342 [Zopfia rhizophila CBS 207.26]
MSLALKYDLASLRAKLIMECRDICPIEVLRKTISENPDPTQALWILDGEGIPEVGTGRVATDNMRGAGDRFDLFDLTSDASVYSQEGRNADRYVVMGGIIDLTSGYSSGEDEDIAHADRIPMTPTESRRNSVQFNVVEGVSRDKDTVMDDLVQYTPLVGKAIVSPILPFVPPYPSTHSSTHRDFLLGPRKFTSFGAVKETDALKSEHLEGHKRS